MEATKIHRDASNIFSFGVSNDCSEINLLSAKRIKKLDKIKSVFPKVVGNKIKKAKKNKKAKLLSLLNPFFFVTKFIMNSEPIKTSNNPTFEPIPSRVSIDSGKF